MKKCLIAVLVLVFAWTTVAFALDVKVGPEIEVTLSKGIELDNLDTDADLSAEYYDVKATIGVGDWLKISPKAGINHMSAVLDSSIGDIELNSGIGWNAGVDADAKVFTTEWADVHVIGGYQFSRTDVDEIDIAGITVDNPFETIVYLHEFEAGVAVSKDLREIDALKKFNIPVTPYVGIVYSDMIGNVDVNLSFIDLDEDISAERNIGLRCGFQAEPINNLFVSVSAKFVDETSIIGVVTYKF